MGLPVSIFQRRRCFEDRIAICLLRIKLQN
jgi:hypothetical protein